MSSSTNLEKSKPERERQDWGIVLFILLMGFLCVIVAAQWALRFSPTWTLNADMGSNLDLNREFLTSKPVVFFEPVDPAILTQPSWMGGFLTPGASYSTGTPLPAAIRTNTAPPTALGATLIPTNTIPVTYTSTAVPTNTLVWLPLPATATRKPGNTDVPNTAVPPPTDTPLPSGDLSITMSDGGVTNYSPNTVLPYTVTVTNNSPFTVNGVVVADPFSVQIDSVSWTCTPFLGATCTAAGVTNIYDILNMPPGSSVTYAIDAHISLSAMGPLLNTATITIPAGFTDTDPLNNMAADTNADPALALNIGLPDGTWNNLGSGGSLTMVISPAIVADGDGAYDFVYYERIAPPPAVPPVTDPRVDMDWVQIQISSDGSTWYTVFYWGNGSSDGNTNVALPAGPWCATETDNCGIPLTSLYNSTGVAINIDGLVPAGSYPWIRITAPGGDDGDGCDIDAIQILP